MHHSTIDIEFTESVAIRSYVIFLKTVLLLSSRRHIRDTSTYALSGEQKFRWLLKENNFKDLTLGLRCLAQKTKKEKGKVKVKIN